MNIIKLKQNLMRYKQTGEYDCINRAKCYVERMGYTFRLKNCKKVHSIMYDGRYTGISLVASKDSWFVV